MNYDDLLANAPDHNSPEFLDYLRANNKVVEDSNNWLVIENFKYHSEEYPWHTAFYKYPSGGWQHALNNMREKYDEWEWLIKAPEKRTVKRFHIHFYKPKDV